MEPNAVAGFTRQADTQPDNAHTRLDRMIKALTHINEDLETLNARLYGPSPKADAATKPKLVAANFTSSLEVLAGLVEDIGAKLHTVTLII